MDGRTAEKQQRVRLLPINLSLDGIALLRTSEIYLIQVINMNYLININIRWRLGVDLGMLKATKESLRKTNLQNLHFDRSVSEQYVDELCNPFSRYSMSHNV